MKMIQSLMEQKEFSVLEPEFWTPFVFKTKQNKKTQNYKYSDEPSRVWYTKDAFCLLFLLCQDCVVSPPVGVV